MDLTNIKKVEDLTLVGDTNRRLEQGWILIDTYTNNYDPNAYPGANTIHYVIGLPSSIEYIDTPQHTNYATPEDLNE